VLRFNAADQDPSSERTRLTPAPSLSRLDDLLTSVRASGLPVTCTVSGAEAALPPGVDLTAYRIVQEALTNALRHAPGSSAAVTIAYEDACLSLEVSNTSRQARTASTPATSTPATTTPVTPAASVTSAALAGGYGLAGIAERVASCGGSLALGPAADGGFTVTARLPLT
jgi:signal transduction histidine kinase